MVGRMCRGERQQSLTTSVHSSSNSSSLLGGLPEHAEGAATADLAQATVDAKLLWWVTEGGRLSCDEKLNGAACRTGAEHTQTMHGMAPPHALFVRLLRSAPLYRTPHIPPPSSSPTHPPTHPPHRSFPCPVHPSAQPCHS